MTHTKTLTNILATLPPGWKNDIIDDVGAGEFAARLLLQAENHNARVVIQHTDQGGNKVALTLVVDKFGTTQRVSVSNENWTAITMSYALFKQLASQLEAANAWALDLGQALEAISCTSTSAL